MLREDGVCVCVFKWCGMSVVCLSVLRLFAILFSSLVLERVCVNEYLNGRTSACLCERVSFWYETLICVCPSFDEEKVGYQVQVQLKTPPLPPT